jgi:predicted branched-subunit amino acid permease
MVMTAHIRSLPAAPIAVRPGTRRVLGEMAPILVALVPLGWALGVTTAASPLAGPAGWAGGPLLLSGAAHFALLSVYASGAGALVALATALAISARGLIYSAALAEPLRPQPAWFRAVAPYFLVDQMFVVADGWFRAGVGPRELRRAYLTAGAALWLTWIAAITAGMLVGPVVPSEWRVELVLGALLVGMLKSALVDRAAVSASGVAAVVTAVATPLPARLGIVAGAVAGILVAGWSERRSR